MDILTLAASEFIKELKGNLDSARRTQSDSTHFLTVPGYLEMWMIGQKEFGQPTCTPSNVHPVKSGEITRIYFVVPLLFVLVILVSFFFLFCFRSINSWN